MSEIVDLEAVRRAVSSAPLAPPLSSGPFDREWRWRVNLPDRKGALCRQLARGAMNSALIEFEDGARFIVSRNAFRKVAR